METIILVPVPLSGIRNDAVIGCYQAPTPVPIHISEDYIRHFDYLMIEQPLKKYIFSYRHDGAEWNLEIEATSPADAKQRVRQLSSATYDGEVVVKLPIPELGPSRFAKSVRKLLVSAFH